MSDAFDVPTEIADVTIVGPLPLPVTGTFTPSGTQDVNIVSSVTLSVTGPLTDTQLRATPVPVTIPTPVPVTDNGGSLTVDGTVAVSNFPATQPVSGTVTANQGTSPWVVSGTISTSPNVNVHDGAGVSISSTGSSLNVDVTNTVPVTGPLTDAQLRATPVPISGTVTSTPSGTQNVSLVATSVTQPISAVSLPLPTGAATAALQTQPGVDIGDVTVNNAAGAAAVNIQDGGNSITVDGTVAVSNFPATQAVTQSTSPWVVSGTITANLGTIAGVATETTLATLLSAKASSASLSNVSASASNVTLLASNSSRKMATFYNDSAFRLFLKFGATASTSSFTVRIDSQGYYEFPLPCYTGQIDGIWNGATGAVRITELS